MSSEMANMSAVGAIGFVHPALALAGVACGAIPVVIHLLNRRRHKRVEWAAMRFLLMASRRSARRLRLEQLLLLVLRIVVVICVGLWVARPYFPSTGVLPYVGTAVHRIIVVDNSLSMDTTIESGTRLDLARQRARELLGTFAPRDPVSVVTLASPATTVVGHAAFDRRFVAETLDAISSTQRGTDVAGGIRAVREILEESPSAPGNRAVYLLSDFQRSDWVRDSTGPAGVGLDASESDFATPAASEAARLADLLTNSADSLVFVQVDGRARENASVESLTAESAFVAPGLWMRFEATVANHATTILEGARVQFRASGRIIGEAPVAALAPGGRVVVTATAQFADAGTHTVESRLIGGRDDHLAIDDARFHTIDVREKTRVLLVDPKPGGGFVDSQSAYLAAALDPGTVRTRNNPVGRIAFNELRGDIQGSFVSPVSVEVVAPHELSLQPLAEFDVVALCNVPAPMRSDWDRLAAFVDEGGGLLVFLGDQVNGQSYNRSGGPDVGGGLLPVTLEQTVRVTEPLGQEPGEAPSTADFLRLARDELGQPFVFEFAQRESSGLFDARIESYVRVRPRAAEGEVVWKYSNGDPAWVFGSRGLGSVLVCTTTANMRWNTLAAKGDYVSMMLNAVSFAARGERDRRNVAVGERIRERLSALEASLPINVSPPGGFRVAPVDPALTRMGTGLAAEVGPVDHSGVWRLHVGAEERQFSVNIDPTESRLESVTEGALRNAVGRALRWVDASQTSFAAQGDRTARSTELSRVAVAVLAGLIVVESLLAMLFGKPLGKRRNVAALEPAVTAESARVAGDAGA